ncbi:hypothetical protein SBOR_3512 [Sclerotinia borealis F-4128]|uniref:Zn(2)-C6 fungal-type domain-containing protein n=1 Tax=Sclerotinia borealis (strain F-4128) TaxID=1432307 RepID=W9CJD5_SCLBF|nr:hypothetical protein SBOR_3512 [Sclerotinia borealis F-4128]
MSAGGGVGVLPPKLIRFVNNDGQRAKRRRVNAACRTCRKRKTRCDGIRPLCSTCTDNGHECMGYTKLMEGAASSIKDVRSPDDDFTPTHLRRPAASRENSRDMVPQQYQQSPNMPPSRSRVDAEQPYMRDTPRVGNEDTENNRPGNRTVDYNDAAVFSDNGPSLLEKGLPLLSETNVNESHRVPYFRYFGPTAIVPGFKQMVVSVREPKRSIGVPSSSSLTMSPVSAKHSSGGSIHGGTPSQAGTDSRSAIDMPLYDPSDSLPVNRLIIHLVEVFFAHLGCNYPFLSKRQENFKHLVEEKKIEPILVDAVCALAARFSDHPLLTTSHESPHPKSEYGQVFAQRAKAAVVDTFPCPSVGAVQACLLLAYESFGANQDSALWMYLGISIRMAVDLGLQTLAGVKHQGQKDPGYHRSFTNEGESSEPANTVTAEEKNEIEEERIDTLWAVLMLDRVISSGTGRPVSLNVEITLPSVSNNTEEAWPDPFPALIRIIHLYGRVSDLLNRIRGADDVTQGLIQQLSGMEKDLTILYQSLDARLGFTASNFQHYVKSGEGTNFILPTLMHSFEGEVLQLLPHSRELSMSSAKTIADILAFADLIDPRSFVGNPFTCQPIYIAGCAFLKEIALHTSQPSSRDVSPRQSPSGPPDTLKPSGNQTNPGYQKQKHSLLAAAANQNYQQCHKALRHLESFWAGTRYIRVALEQKQSGIDPQEVETYTAEEYTEATKPRHEIIPNWRRKFSANSPSRFPDFVRSPMMEALPGSPAIDPAQAIGWSLTGTTNSPSSNLTFMYQNQSAAEHLEVKPQPREYGQGNMIYDPIRQSLPENMAGGTATSGRFDRYPSHFDQMPPVPKFLGVTNSDAAATADAEMLLGLGGSNSPYATPRGSSLPSFNQHPPSNLSPRPGSGSTPGGSGGYDFHHHSTPGQAQGHIYNNHDNNNGNALHGNNNHINSQSGYANNVNVNGYMGMGLGTHMGVSDMMMESQDIDMRGMSEDMMPWLEYMPQDMWLRFYDGAGGGSGDGGAGGVEGEEERRGEERRGEERRGEERRGELERWAEGW